MMVEIQLKYFLTQFEIPIIKKNPKTFLEISKQPHYENVISNIYAFFFNTLEEHNLQNLFIKSLLDVIESNQINFSNFDDFEVVTEFSTKKGGRIDLLLSNKEQAIIIENKIYHHLNNDLDDYWESVNIPNKIGIILSLQPISNSNYAHFNYGSHFMNVTHLNLLKQVQNNLGKYILDGNEKYITFLKDFIQNINNLSSQTMNKKDIDFYFTHQQKIRETKIFLEDIESHIRQEVEKAGQILEGVYLSNPRTNSYANNILRYYISQLKSNLMFTILFDDLLTKENKLVIIVELQNEALKNREVYKKINFTEEELQISFTPNFLNTNTNWAHFALKEYILSADDIYNLSSYILHKIENDGFLSIFKKLQEFMIQNKQ